MHILKFNRPKYMNPSRLQLNTKTIKPLNRKIHNKTHIQLHHISELIAIFIPDYTIPSTKTRRSEAAQKGQDQI